MFLLFSAVVGVTTASVVPIRVASDLFLARQRVEILREKIEKNCPQLLINDPRIEEKRETTNDLLTHKVNSEVETELYQRMLLLYIKCRKTADATTTTTLLAKPNIIHSNLSQCISTSTINLTEYWRNGYNGTELANSDNILLDNVWFRFTGLPANS